MVQDIIEQKINTMENGSAALDVNASILLYDKERVDYHSYFASHGVTSNDATAKELEDPEWVLMDRRSEEHTSELQSRGHLVCRLLLEKKNAIQDRIKPAHYINSRCNR